MAVCDRLGITTGIEGYWTIRDVAGDMVLPLMDFPNRVDLHALALGYAGVRGSFPLILSKLT